MPSLLQRVFFSLIIRPIVTIVIGLNVRHGERLPLNGPAILVANHNSHLDTVVLMTLFPARMLARLRPVAAADYFLRNRLLAAFALNVMHIIPIRRGGTAQGDPLADASRALDDGDVLILFPEGTRGEPEQLGAFKSGVAHLARRHPDVPVYPIYMHGLGKALPKGSFVLVPFFCDVFIGEGVNGQEDHRAFTALLSERMHALEAEGGLRAVVLTLIVASVWGLAEATLFFVVPDVYLTWIALDDLRLSLCACGATLAGALAGGAVMHSWGHRDSAGAEKAVDAVPGITPATIARVERELRTRGWFSMFTGSILGVPYKIYAIKNGSLGRGLAPFLAVSVFARAFRFVVLAVVVSWLSQFLSDVPMWQRQVGLIGAWTLVYVVYFKVKGW